MVLFGRWNDFQDKEFQRFFKAQLETLRTSFHEDLTPKMDAQGNPISHVHGDWIKVLSVTWKNWRQAGGARQIGEAKTINNCVRPLFDALFDEWNKASHSALYSQGRGEITNKASQARMQANAATNAHVVPAAPAQKQPQKPEPVKTDDKAAASDDDGTSDCSYDDDEDDSHAKNRGGHKNDMSLVIRATYSPTNEEVHLPLLCGEDTPYSAGKSKVRKLKILKDQRKLWKDSRDALHASSIASGCWFDIPVFTYQAVGYNGNGNGTVGCRARYHVLSL